MRTHFIRLAPLAAAAAAALALPAAAGAAVTDYQAKVKAAGPSLYWTLDDAAGATTVADASGNGRTGTATGVAFGRPGAFTLSNTSADLPSRATITGNPGAVQVIELWVRPTSKGAQTLASRGTLAAGGWELALNSKKKLVFKSGAATVDPKINLPVGAWSMIDVAWKGRDVWFVTNGGLTKSREMKNKLGAAPTTTAALTLGAAGGAVGRGLDELALYPTAPADYAAFKAFAAGHFNAAKLPVNQSPPAINVPAGGYVDGRTLTVKPGTWSGSPTSPYAYQWMRCDLPSSNDEQACDAIDGATGTSYTLTPADIGSYLVVEETVRNTAGTAYADSNSSGQVQPLPPTISGIADEGQTLAANPHTSNGTVLTWTYRWQRCNVAETTCTEVGTDATYTLQAADAGKKVRVEAKTAGVSAWSGFTPEITSSGSPVAAPVNHGKPTIDGPLEAGQELTSAPGLWTGNPAPTFAYQWLRCDAVGGTCEPIPGATKVKYTLTTDDVDHTIVLEVTASNSQDTVAEKSEATGVVTAAPKTDPNPNPGTNPGTKPPVTNPGTKPPVTKPGSGVGCAVRLAFVPKAKLGKVRGIGKVSLRLKRTKAGALRLVVKARKGKVRKVAFKLDRKVLKGKKRVLNRKLRLKGLTAGRHVARVKITPKRGKAKTLKLALRVKGC